MDLISDKLVIVIASGVVNHIASCATTDDQERYFTECVNDKLSRDPDPEEYETGYVEIGLSGSVCMCTNDETVGKIGIS